MLIALLISRGLNVDVLQVYSKGSVIPSHHHFLNEARLSAIALAIFFAGLLVSIPPPAPGAPAYPCLLVLDDVLIGLDMSNRIPVLDMVKRYFEDWQVFIFTHDKVWNEIVWLDTKDFGSWCYHSLYAAVAHDGIEAPVHRPQNTGWPFFLAQAQEYLNADDERAAVTYARAAF